MRKSHMILDHHGFTLLEIMVAVAILGLAFVVIMQIFSIGLKSSMIDSQYSRAVFLAKTKMNEVLTSLDFEEGEDSGEFEDGYEWTVQIEEFERPESDEKVPQAAIVETSFDEEEERYNLYRAKVRVMWSSGGEGKKHVELNTLRIVPVDESVLVEIPE